MSRHGKTTSQQTIFHNSNPQGCWKDYVLQDNVQDSLDLFKIGKAESMASTTPAFIVPAIMDAIRSCKRYRDVVKLVPGEADMYCAKHATESGAIIFSSDSDLLAHDLHSGAVALFRDITKHDGTLQAAVFTPTAICERLGLEIPMAPTRLAYERLRDKNYNMDALVRACKSPPIDLPDYTRFKQQYVYDDSMDTLLLKVEKQFQFRHMDPRTSEVMLQLVVPDRLHDIEPAIFLPALMESSERGTAWEPSTPIRQLAYSFVLNTGKGIPPCVYEYRRVQSAAQKGRRVEMLNQPATTTTASDMLSISTKLQGFAGSDTQLFWLSLCLILDIQSGVQQGKYSHALHVLKAHRQKQLRLSSRISWDLVHLIAQLHAGLYSFRILHQIFQSCKSLVKPQLDVHFGNFDKLLNGVPPLTSYPDATSTIDFLSKAIDKGIFKQLQQMSLVEAEETNPQHAKRSSTTSDKSTSRKKPKADHKPEPKFKSANPFDALLNDL